MASPGFDPRALLSLIASRGAGGAGASATGTGTAGPMVGNASAQLQGADPKFALKQVQKMKQDAANLIAPLAFRVPAAARALALRAPLEPSAVTGAIAGRVNALSGGPGPDRWLSPEIAAISDLVANRELLDIASRYLTLH